MKRRFQNLSMSEKMTVTLIIPLVLISVILFFIFYPIIRKQYSERVFTTVQQSVDQAGSFLNEYILSMQFRLDKLCTDKDLIGMLSDPKFGHPENAAEEFREFYHLQERVMAIQVLDNRYQMGIYVPDELSYSLSRFYIYPESDLEQMPEGREILEKVDEGKTAVTLGSHKNTASVEDPFEALVMFRRIFSEEGKPLNVVRTSIGTSVLKKILLNADVTETGLMILLDQDDNILFHSGAIEETDLQTLVEEWIRKGEPDELQQIEYKGTRYYSEVSDFQFRLIALIPVDEIRAQIGKVMLLLFLLVSSLIAATLIISSFMIRWYVRRLSFLTEKMEDIENGDINTRFELERNEETRDEIEHIYYDFNYMAERVRVLLHEHYLMGKNVQAAELRALQAQINPHFLYNTLDLVNWMALDYDAQEIADITHDLARFYRLSLNHGRNLLTIGEEIEHVESYVRIENVHFDDAITLTVRVPEELRGYGCPNIILQPFVENCIVHGIAEHPEIDSCRIDISAKRDGDDIVFTVSDDGPGIDKSILPELMTTDYKASTKGYGVKNINFRLKLYFGEQYGIDYDGTSSSGTVVHVRIPARTPEEMTKESGL